MRVCKRNGSPASTEPQNFLTYIIIFVKPVSAELLEMDSLVCFSSSYTKDRSAEISTEQSPIKLIIPTWVVDVNGG